MDVVARQQLSLDSCPHCGISHPVLTRFHSQETTGHSGQNKRTWVFYGCSSCGGVTMTYTLHGSTTIIQYWPTPQSASIDLPERAREYLQQALRTRHAPAGSIMLACSAVDAMLKGKGYKTGNLYSRRTHARYRRAIHRPAATPRTRADVPRSLRGPGQ